MAAITNFVGWRHESRDSTPCNWNAWRSWLFCCYCRHGRRVNSLCQITERLLIFMISTAPPKSLLDQYICGHTHHWSHSYSIAVSRFGSDAHNNISTLQYPVDPESSLYILSVPKTIPHPAIKHNTIPWNLFLTSLVVQWSWLWRSSWCGLEAHSAQWYFIFLPIHFF